MKLLLLLGLATWRISSIVIDEAGPLNVFGEARHRLGVDAPGRIVPGSLQELATCLWCLSVWVGAALCLAVRLVPKVAMPVLWVFATSAGAILVAKRV